MGSRRRSGAGCLTPHEAMGYETGVVERKAQFYRHLTQPRQ
jgi:hypothetical protein